MKNLIMCIQHRGITYMCNTGITRMGAGFNHQIKCVYTQIGSLGKKRLIYVGGCIYIHIYTILINPYRTGVIAVYKNV